MGSTKNSRKASLLGLKYCPRCDSMKEFAEFSSSKLRNKSDCLRGYCRKCWSDDTRFRRFRVSKDWYAATLLAQKNRCVCCGVHFCGLSRNTTPCIDHDHATGKARGILCPRCNSALGHCGDDINILVKLIEYLKEHKKAD